MITLYGWGPGFGCPSPSPYVMKSDMQLQMLGVEFDRAIADLESIPKGKAPYMKDGDLLIEDSNFIRAHMEKKLGKNLDDGLSDAEIGTGWALERMVESNLYSCILYERWLIPENFKKGPATFFMGIPEDARAQVIEEVLTQIKTSYWGTGFGRHSREERLKFAEWDILAIAAALGEKDYLFGDSPKAGDASVASMLITGATPYFDTPVEELITRHENLAAYMERVKSRYFSEAKWPTPEMA